VVAGSSFFETGDEAMALVTESQATFDRRSNSSSPRRRQRARRLRRGRGRARPRRPRTEAWASWRLFLGAERLTLPSRCGCLDCVEQAMARDRVFEGGAEVRSIAVVAGEMRVRLGDVGGRPRDLRRRPPVLLRHRQELECGLRAVAAADLELPDLGLAAGSGEL